MVAVGCRRWTNVSRSTIRWYIAVQRSTVAPTSALLGHGHPLRIEIRRFSRRLALHHCRHVLVVSINLSRGLVYCVHPSGGVRTRRGLEAHVLLSLQSWNRPDQESGGHLCRNFQILIVTAVKICKQCLQTASVSGALRPQIPHRSYAPGPHLGTSPRLSGLQLPKWKFLAPPVSAIAPLTQLAIYCRNNSRQIHASWWWQVPIFGLNLYPSLYA